MPGEFRYECACDGTLLVYKSLDKVMDGVINGVMGFG